jgi:DNA-binding CsgD family transcriptional regulator
LGIDFYSSGGYRGGLRLLRPKDQQDFGIEEKQLCELTIPHVKRALAINSLRSDIQSELDLYSGAVNQLDIGTLIVDKDCRIIKHNAVAKTLFDENDGIFMQGTKFCVKDRDLLRDIQELLTEISRKSSDNQGLVKGFRISRRANKSPIALLIRPINNATFYTGNMKPVAAFFIRDPDSGIQIAEDISREIFGFTKKEATVARMLADGMTIEEICTTMCLSKTTVRTHLRAIFTKTDVHHQSGLVKLMWSSITHMGATNVPE